ncbi:hypothetical protein JL722_13918 [Aureococcus anophagefferens]|nr:hypothetical protein JL722_13918 [Aureococcus anophagefferens]
MTTAHAIAFCAGPLIVALLLAISGAFTQSAKTAARPPHAHVAFTSRFGARLSGNAHSLLLVCLMAALAECWNSVVTPDLGSVLGAKRDKETVDLSTPYLLGCLLLGPAFHLLGRAGAAFRRGAAARRRRGPRGAARGAPGRGARARVRRGPGPRRRARLRLRRHGAAASPGELVATSSTTSCPSPPAAGASPAHPGARASPGAAQVHEGEVNWGTAFANAVALCVEINQ